MLHAPHRGFLGRRLSAALLVGCSLFALAWPADALNVEFRGAWGTPGTGAGQFSLANGLGIDSQGNVYVAEFDLDRVQKFDATGLLLRTWTGSGSELIDQPIGLAVDASDRVFVVNAGSGRVQAYDTDGALLFAFGSRATEPGDGQFNWATDIAIAPDGTLYVTDQGDGGGRGHSIQAFDTHGNFLFRWGTFGASNGEFYHPFGIAADSLGNLYVTDGVNHRIQKFDGVGNWLASWGGLGSADGQFQRPAGIGLDLSGRVYVADLLNHRVQVFDPDGTFRAHMGGGFGNGAGQMIYPFDVAAGSDGSTYILDFGNGRIQRFSVPFEVPFEIGGGGNSTINLRSNGLILLAVLTTSRADGEAIDFDATDIIVSSLALGPDGAAPFHANGHPQDVDGDGDTDLVLHFRIRETGISCGDPSVALSGELTSGAIFEGEADIDTRC